jgi:hypothetical protein
VLLLEAAVALPEHAAAELGPLVEEQHSACDLDRAPARA